MAKDAAGDGSEAYRLVSYVWGHKHCRAWTSWGKTGNGVNDVMHSTVRLAIQSGLEFAEGDFADVYKEMRGGYWFGDYGGKGGLGEGFYRLAVLCRHLTACKSFEAWKGRPPYKWLGERLAAGSEFPWEGLTVTVTSLLPAHLIACSYRHTEGGEKRVERVFRLTAAELAAASLAEKKAAFERLPEEEREERRRREEEKKAARSNERRASARGARAEVKMMIDREAGRVYKVIHEGGASVHGGSLIWSLPEQRPDGAWRPGKWHRVAGRLDWCNVGLHLTGRPAVWWKEDLEGCAVFEAEYRGRTIGDPFAPPDSYKICVREARLVRRVPDAELVEMGILDPPARRRKAA